MTLTSASMSPTAPPTRWRLPLALASVSAGLVASWAGGPWGLLGALLIAVGAVALVRHRETAATGAAAAESDRGPDAADPYARDEARGGASVMVATVVPVWSRQIDVTRTAASDGLGQLLEIFASMSSALGTLTEQLSSFSLSAEPGAVDAAVRREQPALDALTTASRRAFTDRDEAVAALGRCADGLSTLQQHAKQAREIARHTRLVAFNAAIEANRNRTQADGGSHALATELRTLATRMADTGEQIERLVRQLSDSIRVARREGEVGDTTASELRLEIDLRAREAMAAMLGSMGASLQGSAEVQQAATTLRDQLDGAFVHFQFGDRISQMLSIVGNDMGNFVDWVAAHPHATQQDAAQWLAALESSYTMDEQRSHHHGNVHVTRDSGVEFF